MERERPSYQEGGHRLIRKVQPLMSAFSVLHLFGSFLLEEEGERRCLIWPLLPVAFTRDSHVRDLDS